MGKALSNDLRERLIRNVESGMSARAAGRKLDIAASTATRIVREWRERGCYKARLRGGHKPCLLWPHRAYIERLVKDHNDWSEAQYGEAIEAATGVRLHATSVGRFIRRMGYRYKKNGIRLRTDP